MVDEQKIKLLKEQTLQLFFSSQLGHPIHTELVKLIKQLS